MTRVAWLGLGAMGTPMARRLLAVAEELAVFDPLPERARVLGEEGARAATTPLEAAADAEVLFVMVATPEQAQQSLFGDAGAAAGLSTRGTVVVMSTIGPAAVGGLAERLTAAQVAVLDAPVSGGVGRAETGELVIMVGGSEERFEAVRPLLERLGTTVVRVGEAVGDGQAVKLVNQLLCGVHIAAAAEALGFAAALGLEPRAVWEVIRHGAAGSFMLDDRGARMLDGVFEPVRSALDIFVKDMGLVTDAARAKKLPTPLATAAEQLYLMGAADGLGRVDDSAVVKLFERWAGQSVARRSGSGGSPRAD